MMASTNGSDLSQQQQNQNQEHHQQWIAMQQQYQQQWMSMQYPATAMVMQHQLVYGQHPYMAAAAATAAHYQQQPPPHHHHPYHQHQQHKPSYPQYQQNMSSEDNKTIWIGDLHQWMDETYLQSCFAQTGEVVSVKVIRNKQTGQSERYGFVEFNSHAAAEKVLQSYNGTTMPSAEQPFRLNWAAFSTGDRRPDSGSDLSIFAGDLASDVTDTLLYETFASKYTSVKGAKVVVDSNTGHSKGYGFVRFGDENERSRAMTEMNGIYCSSRPMRIGAATSKKPPGQQQYSSQAGGYSANGAAPHGSQSDGDSPNTTIFVGGLDADVTDEELRQTFSQFGKILSVKIPAGKGCGFIQFANRSNAEDAIQRLNGTVIGKQTVRLSWGRSQANKQSRMDSSGQWNGAYHGRQGYAGYGYSIH